MIGRVCEYLREYDDFEVTVGVKQGCVIAPSIFSLFFAVMLEEATEDMPHRDSGTEVYSTFLG